MLRWLLLSGKWLTNVPGGHDAITWKAWKLRKPLSGKEMEE